MKNESYSLNILTLDSLGSSDFLPVGYWVTSDSIMWGVYKKHPSWFHRKMTKLILGWDYKKIKEKIEL